MISIRKRWRAGFGTIVLAAWQTGMRPREDRVRVLIPSRMRTGTQWVDIVIHNLSSRGLMAATDAPPAAGSYVEIRRGTQVVVGRVVWTKGRFFGARSQDRIPIRALVDEPRLAGRPQRAADVSEAVERRADRRLAAEARLARRVERSRTFASIFQFAAIAAVSLVLAGFAANSVYTLLSRPAAAITGAMDASSAG